MARCSVNSFAYNGSSCACNPGYFRDPLGGQCNLFDAQSTDWISDEGVKYENAFTRTIFSFNSLKTITQSQALFLEATTLAVAIWLLFCVLLRFAPLNDGQSQWFRLRYWLSRLDICFSTRHWLDEQKIVVKRKTELGGTFSIASGIFFLGLVAALLYQIISKRNVEVQNVRPTNAPDLKNFVNDVEFNVTTISSMSCAQLHGLGSLRTGIPGFIDYRTSPLSEFMKSDCHNTSRGPTIRFQCSRCQFVSDNSYISWHFVDIPNSPVAAVGFHFNLTARTPGTDEHVSVLSGAVKAGKNSSDNRPTTLRGTMGNILKFRLVPRLFQNVHHLRLIQAFFHEFIPGSSYTRASELQASFQRPTDGLLNVTFHINFLSDYIVEIDTEHIMGPVTFLADLGGLYAISIALFFYLLVQCEYRVKRFRYEDGFLHRLEARRLARQRWDKLRRYVKYTWGRDSSEALSLGKREKSGMTVHKTKRTHQPLEIDDNVKRSRQEPCSKSRGVKKQSRGPLLKNLVPKVSGKDNNKESLAEENVGREGRLKGALCIEPVLEQESQSIEINDQKERPTASKKAENLGRTPPWLTTKKPLPAVPGKGHLVFSEINMILVQLTCGRYASKCALMARWISHICTTIL